MADLVPVVARLRALQQGHAIPVVSQRQVAIQPHAIVLTMLAMAGEDTSVHAVAIGQLGHTADIMVVSDPRRRDDQYALLRWLLPRFEAYYAQCLERQTFPQIWVSSAGSLAHLDTLADRLRFTDNPEVQRLGTLLTYAGERSPVAGQQALISATAALRAHYATGQQEAEDEHLGALLTWIEPPVGRDIYASVASAELQPMSVKTDPGFDTSSLQPAVQDFNAARSNGASPAELAFHDTRIRQMMETIIRPIYTATQRAAALLSQPRWAANPALDALAEQEADAFERFMAARREGHHLPYNDRPKAGALKLIARERAVANVTAGAVRHDRAAREKNVANGRVLRVNVVELQTVKIAPRLFEHALVLESAQDGLHLRAPDILWCLDGETLSVRVREVRRLGGRTRITCDVVKGKNRAKRLAAGDVLDFGPEAPNWNGLSFELARMGGRLQNPPWTHGEDVPIATPSTRVTPSDLLAAVERLA